MPFGTDTEERAEIAQEVLSAADRFFRPEFLNRVQKRIVFQPLSREVLQGILGKLVANLNDRVINHAHRAWL
jgi:ATP-dependent Clp protease ATP-binding subunit ClpA